MRGGVNRDYGVTELSCPAVIWCKNDIGAKCRCTGTAGPSRAHSAFVGPERRYGPGAADSKRPEIDWPTDSRYRCAEELQSRGHLRRGGRSSAHRESRFD